jgi:hypothetical protein
MSTQFFAIFLNFDWLFLYSLNFNLTSFEMKDSFELSVQFMTDKHFTFFSLFIFWLSFLLLFKMKFLFRLSYHLFRVSAFILICLILEISWFAFPALPDIYSILRGLFFLLIHQFSIFYFRYITILWGVTIFSWTWSFTLFRCQNWRTLNKMWILVFMPHFNRRNLEI